MSDHENKGHGGPHEHCPSDRQALRRAWHHHRGGRGGHGGGQGQGPGGPGPWGGPWGSAAYGAYGPPWARRGPRARRGDVRDAVLALLAEEPMHGYQIIQELGERTGGAWRPSPGSVYPTLQLLEDEGLVVATERDGKRVFEITDAGKKALADRDVTTPPWEQFSEGFPEDATRLMRSMQQAGAAAMQAMTAGSAEQRTRVADILDDARKKIYGILAESS